MKNRKLSVPDWCFFRKEFAPAIYYKQLKTFGFSGVEMVAEERRKSAIDAGLQIVNLAAPGMTEGMNRQENQQKLTDNILQVIDEAQKMSIPWVIVFSGNKGNLTYQEGLDNCLVGYSKILERIKGSGVGLLFEMLNRFDHADYQADGEKFGFELTKHLNSPNFKVLYDVYHIVKSGENPFTETTKKLPYIGHFHIAALEGRGFPKRGGKIDYDSFFQSIPDDAFDGYFGMEFRTDFPMVDLPRVMELFGRK